MAEQSLKEKTAKGLFWGGLSNGVQQLLNLFFGIFLSRILNAEDYGMVGMLSIFSLIAGSLQESGFTAALANKREISHKDYNAVFWFSTGLSACPVSYTHLYQPLPWLGQKGMDGENHSKRQHTMETSLRFQRLGQFHCQKARHNPDSCQYTYRSWKAGHHARYTRQRTDKMCIRDRPSSLRLR